MYVCVFENEDLFVFCLPISTLKCPFEVYQLLLLKSMSLPSKTNSHLLNASYLLFSPVKECITNWKYFYYTKLHT